MSLSDWAVARSPSPKEACGGAVRASLLIFRALGDRIARRPLLSISCIVS